ncbi:MAG: FMN-binding glutamate synthase family protein [Methylacidiphilales bacterium]|nr:FMN-binding glutamate synthase family protein [Candidatus Methylacidiphilales bacterium]
MPMQTLNELIFLASNFITIVVSVGVVVLIVTVITLYIKDRTQTSHAILRNYPVIGRFRYYFEHLGEFFRQYFFSLDRDEMPFNRSERSWVYRSAKKIDNTIAFGSTRRIDEDGTILFANNQTPILDSEALPTPPVTIGSYCKNPYQTASLVNISAMSFGAISEPAVLALSKGAKKCGCWFNTGEGGLSPHHLAGGCDIIFQIGTAKYGVRELDGSLSKTKLQSIAAIPEVKMFELKLSQGAKPGKGGILPAIKITQEVADIRGIEVGKDSISPNRHLEIKSVNELLDFISMIRDVTGKPVGIKTVLGEYEWIQELCEKILQRGQEYAPDFITLDSTDGGSGAAPMSLMDYVGLPIRETVPQTVNILLEANLKKRIMVCASGKLITPDKVAWAYALGADFVNTARGFMFALGCIQSLKCNLNTCPTGITTHDKKLQRGLNPTDKAERVANYARGLSKEVETISHSCGVAHPRLLRRKHVRLLRRFGPSLRLDEIRPYPKNTSM